MERIKEKKVEKERENAERVEKEEESNPCMSPCPVS